MKTVKIILAIVSILISPFVYGQTASITLTTECGKVIESEFTNQNEVQDVRIRMGAGDVLEVTIIPVGKYLKVTGDLFDPSGSHIINGGNGMFGTDKKSLVVKSETLSASGVYTLRIGNRDHSYGTTMVGAYTVYVKCIKRNGDVVEPK